MDAAVSLRSSLGVSSSLGFMAKSGFMASLCPHPLSFNGASQLLDRRLRNWPSVSLPRHGHGQFFAGTWRKLCIRASCPDFSDPDPPLAPLELESPVGQFLSHILTSQPHLFPAAVETQLENLQIDRDSEEERKEPFGPSLNPSLSRRIAEVKAKERNKVLEEILYALVVQKFVNAEILMMPAIRMVARWWDYEEGKNTLELFHSPEALEMINNHLSRILGLRVTDLSTVRPISTLQIGRVYASSVTYGYFLRRVDQRFQLEKSYETCGSVEEESDTRQVMPDQLLRPKEYGWIVASHPDDSVVENSTWFLGFGPGVSNEGVKPSLWSYIMSLETDIFQSYARISSKEVISIIEKHTGALLGRPEMFINPVGAKNSLRGEFIKISFGVLKSLMLEAVTFGSFLRDAVSYVDSRYRLY
ncbi:hypothetical protein QJS04_geneDACA017430 [Acorus gramineus]|uniref:Uncharacterized protein n=1 Tax=Acorus gramineus TaxID=55184 RepID=A0AAV9AH19_ACOGR|nr:hypothetical protein QJS04_geneDACA017430 [Acorus gramineus]